MSEDNYGPQPPQDVEAERATLGAMLLSGKAIADVMEVLTAADFYRPAHATIFDAIVHLSGAGEVDPILVSAELEKRGKLANVGGSMYVFSLSQDCVTPANVLYYAKIITRKARARRMIETGIRWQQLGFSDMATDEELDLVVAQAEEFLRGVQKPTDFGVMAADLFAQWQTYEPSSADILPTPWPELTEYLGGGYRLGKLYVLAGRPGSGKSMGGLNCILEMAEAGHAVTIFSLEMGSLEVAERILSSGAYASYNEIFRRRMDPDTTAARVSEYIASNAAMNLEVIDRSAITVEQIAAHVRNRKPKAVFIDYCQLISPSFKGDRREVVDHITRSLKVLAKDTNTCIILASQVNRNGADRMPTIADLRESGSIENDADCVLLLHREEGAGTVKLNVGKNRNGQMGTIEFIWRGEVMRIG